MKKNYRLSCFLICGDMQVHHKNTCLTGHKNTLAQLVCRMCGHLPLLLRDCPLFFHSFLLFWHVLSFLFFFDCYFHTLKSTKCPVFYENYGSVSQLDVSKLFPKRFQSDSKTNPKRCEDDLVCQNCFQIVLELIWNQFGNYSKTRNQLGPVKSSFKPIYYALKIAWVKFDHMGFWSVSRP